MSDFKQRAALLYFLSILKHIGHLKIYVPEKQSGYLGGLVMAIVGIRIPN